uniref:Uncharacterized protein n=1 Tax=Arundo donax TaxID=35708 RepID=A0A0A9FHS0_ARUDO
MAYREPGIFPRLSPLFLLHTGRHLSLPTCHARKAHQHIRALAIPSARVCFPLP